MLASLDRPFATPADDAPFVLRLGVVERLWAYASATDIPDRGRAFALSFFLCCIEGELALRTVASALPRAHPRTYPAFIDAFALGSNPSIDATLSGLLASELPGVLQVALASAQRRRFVELGVMIPLCAHPDPRIAELATACLHHAPPEVAAEALSDVLVAPPSVSLKAAEGLIVMGRPSGLEHARAMVQRRLIDDGGGDPLGFRALALVALAGRGVDRDLLHQAVRTRPDAVAWLGWHGDSSHIEVLLEMLSQRGGTAPGVGSWLEIERDIHCALHRLLGDPRVSEKSAPPWTRATTVPSSTWREHWQRNREGLARRIRFGAPHSAQLITKELQASSTRQAERRHLATELAIFRSAPVPFDLDGWIAAQRMAIAFLESDAPAAAAEASRS